MPESEHHCRTRGWTSFSIGSLAIQPASSQTPPRRTRRGEVGCIFDEGEFNMDTLERFPLTVKDLRAALDHMEETGVITPETIVRIDRDNDLISMGCENNRVVLFCR